VRRWHHGRIVQVRRIFKPISRQSRTAVRATSSLRLQESIPKLPARVKRLRDQKICSYCRHLITEDPYSHRERYWVQLLRLRMLRWSAALLRIFAPQRLARNEARQKRIVLPGWVRCSNRRCGQLYHANCWHHRGGTQRCFRCHSNRARHVA